MPSVEPFFKEGDWVETIQGTVLLPLGIRTKILEAAPDRYMVDLDNKLDGYGYLITFRDYSGYEWTLDYHSQYFELAKEM